MNDTGYKAVGVVVWRGGKWYLQRRYGRLMVPKKAVVGVAVGIGVLGALAVWRS